MTNVFRSAAALLVLLAGASLASACPYCKERPQIWAGIFGENFVSTLLQATLAVPLLIALGLAFHLADRKPFRRAAQDGAAGAAIASPVRRGPFLSAGITIGIGMGGFLDGILLHMLLQWHNLIAERIPPTDFVTLEINMFWDGVFNLGMWIITAVGLGLLWRASRLADVLWSGKALFGTLLAGWGIFQIVDSIIFHWTFHLHHIKLGSPNWLFWDIGYFVMGLALIGAGWALVRAGQRSAATRATA